ncbi:MAG: formate--tetrahydrofolate ligase [Bacteroidota bacterium]
MLPKHRMKPIQDIARAAGIPTDRLIQYGNFKAKLDHAALDPSLPTGKLVLVTSITPTRAGNGKTTTSIGLADGLRSIGKRAVLALREPSLGPVFGMKGGATGGGKSSVVPSEDINLHFNGDFHAISAANNTLSALLDNYNYNKQGTGQQLSEITWKRVLDVNDRSLRHVITGLRGSANGIPGETGFDITPASELMAILCLSTSLDDLKNRIEHILLGYREDGTPFTVHELGVAGAITAILKDSLSPNLVQTLEGTPAFVHGGPFANIAHGCNSLLATRAALQFGEFAVTEAGFGSDLGAEKFVDIKCRVGGLTPAVAVVVVTAQSLKLHGGVAQVDIKKPNRTALLAGMKNMDHHLDILRGMGIPVVVALNRFDSDSSEEMQDMLEACASRNVPAAVNEAFARGSAGSADLARVVVEVTEKQSAQLKPVYDLEDSIPKKLEKVAMQVYGAKGIKMSKKAERALKRIGQLQMDKYPVCIAKTQYSFSDRPEDAKAEGGFYINVDELIINSGAGFIVAVCGEIMRMPGLPENPNALGIDVKDGVIVGLV